MALLSVNPVMTHLVLQIYQKPIGIRYQVYKMDKTWLTSKYKPASALSPKVSVQSKYRIRQNIRGGKLSRFSRILAKRESFTIESFPSSQLENFIIIP